MVSDRHPNKCDDESTPACLPSLRVGIVLVGATDPITQWTLHCGREVRSPFVHNSSLTSQSARRISAWWQSPMRRVDKVRPPSGRVARRFHILTQAVSNGADQFHGSEVRS
jgi:hypothetical protein